MLPLSPHLQQASPSTLWHLQFPKFPRGPTLVLESHSYESAPTIAGQHAYIFPLHPQNLIVVHFSTFQMTCSCLLQTNEKHGHAYTYIQLHRTYILIEVRMDIFFRQTAALTCVGCIVDRKQPMSTSKLRRPVHTSRSLREHALT